MRGQAVRRGGKPFDLNAREFRILAYLARNEGRVVTRSMLLEHVWDYHFDPQTNIIDQHVSRLRQKVDRGFGGTLIHTVRGTGYMMRAGGCTARRDCGVDCRSEEARLGNECVRTCRTWWSACHYKKHQI